ncbi:hypothetical protein ACT2CV_02045 [Pasteurellaceae bacterium 22721_9_1]
MSKKRKALLTFSAVALALGTAGQFYTNYKIDQTLSQFPYQLKDQFHISVSESNRDFITRDLTFSIEHNGQKTDFIQTKLTALPAMINAESKLTPEIIKSLNKQLNITIDKNTIINQFLAFSDNLSSRMITEFRDGTNKSQTLESELTYSNNKQTIALQTQLSGFNYDKMLNLKELSGEFLLSPVKDSLYDLVKADLTIKKTDINLLDGDNTHIGIVKGQYKIDKKITDIGYDLVQSFKTPGIYFSNKATKFDEDKTRFQDFALSTKHTGVPSHITFIEQLKQFETENFDFNKLLQYVSDILFNNQQFESKIAIGAFISPENALEFKKADFSTTFNNQDKHNVVHQYETNIGTLSISDKNSNDLPAITLTDLNGKSEFSQLDLSENLAFLARYTPSNINELDKSKKSTKAFLTDLKKMASNYKTELTSQLTLKKLAIKNKISGENLQLNYQEKPTKDSLNIDSNIKIGKLIVEDQQVHFKQSEFKLPFAWLSNDEFYQSYICNNTFYSVLCFYHLGEEEYANVAIKMYQKLGGEINNAVLTSEIDTYPKATGPAPVEFKLDLTTNGKFIDPVAVFYGSDSPLKLNLTGALSTELTQPNKPDTLFWQQIAQAIQQGLFIKNEQNNKYEFELRYENNQIWQNSIKAEETQKSME